jgi:hypothetical protein
MHGNFKVLLFPFINYAQLVLTGYPLPRLSAGSGIISFYHPHAYFLTLSIPIALRKFA